ncbi:MAG: hypothetical protein ACJAT7_001951 [Psychromonas sp.]|jgi:hypothetical protein
MNHRIVVLGRRDKKMRIIEQCFYFLPAIVQQGKLFISYCHFQINRFNTLPVQNT